MTADNPAPLTPADLAAIRQRADFVANPKPDGGVGEMWIAVKQSISDVPRLLDEVERLRTEQANALADLDILIQGAAYLRARTDIAEGQSAKLRMERLERENSELRKDVI